MYVISHRDGITVMQCYRKTVPHRNCIIEIEYSKYVTDRFILIDICAVSQKFSTRGMVLQRWLR